MTYRQLRRRALLGVLAFVIVLLAASGWAWLDLVNGLCELK